MKREIGLSHCTALLTPCFEITRRGLDSRIAFGSRDGPGAQPYPFAFAGSGVVIPSQSTGPTGLASIELWCAVKQPLVQCDWGHAEESCCSRRSGFTRLCPITQPAALYKGHRSVIACSRSNHDAANYSPPSFVLVISRSSADCMSEASDIPNGLAEIRTPLHAKFDPLAAKKVCPIIFY